MLGLVSKAGHGCAVIPSGARNLAANGTEARFLAPLGMTKTSSPGFEIELSVWLLREQAVVGGLLKRCGGSMMRGLTC
jgi:hypothetical protein